jgi:hypothetical protein
MTQRDKQPHLERTRPGSLPLGTVFVSIGANSMFWAQCFSSTLMLCDALFPTNPLVSSGIADHPQARIFL